MARTMTVVGALGVGAGLVYLVDTNRDARRRDLIRDQAVRGYHNVRSFIGKASRDLTNRARGVFARGRERLLHRSSPDPEVREVMNELEPHTREEKIPSLPGGTRPSGESSEWRQRNWTPALQLAAGLVGVAVAAFMTRALMARNRDMSRSPSLKSPLWALLQQRQARVDGSRSPAARSATTNQSTDARTAPWW